MTHAPHTPPKGPSGISLPARIIEVHHFDMEKHAASFNDGYETALKQQLADNPLLAEDWFDRQVAKAKAAGVMAAQNRLVNRDQFSYRTLRILDELANEYLTQANGEGEL